MLHRYNSWLIAALLFILFVCQVLLHARAASPTFDEPTHLVAGLRHLQCRNFAPNPEHPPLVKLIAAAGARVPMVSPQWPCDSASFNDYATLTSIGGDLLSSPPGLRSLFRARVAVSVFALCLALLVFAAAREMFGIVAGLIALAVLAFEPTLIAHSAIVSTDMALAATMFGFSYTLYRYASRPSPGRLLAAALCAGLMVATKHSAIAMLPVIGVLLVVSDLGDARKTIGRWLIAASVIIIGVLTIVWATYSFRLSAVPGSVGARFSLLPEAYLQGMAYVVEHSTRRTFLLGNRYPEGIWYYFPVALTIKTSLTLLALLLLAALTPSALRGKRREILFLLAPAAVYLALAMFSNFNIGIRHILPLYPFLIVIVSAAAAAWTQRSNATRLIVTGALLVHAAIAAATYPDYIAFSNTLWGGPRNTYKVLADSNADWGQDALRVAEHARMRGGPCWYAHYGSGALVRLTPCRALPSLGWTSTHESVQPIPSVLQGTVYLTINVVPPRGLYEYDLFRTKKPIDQIGGSTLVYEGSFPVRVLSGISFAEYSKWLLRFQRVDEALAAARQGVVLAPDEPRTYAALAGASFAAGRTEQGRAAVRRASELSAAD